MQVVRQDYNCIDGKGAFFAGQTKRRAKRVGIINKRRRTPVGERNRKEESATGDEITPVAHHSLSLSRISLRSIRATTRVGRMERSGMRRRRSPDFALRAPSGLRNHLDVPPGAGVWCARQNGSAP